MIIHFIFTIAGIYLACGFVFAVVFIFRGVQVIDEGARDSSLGFKMIIIPGIMIFWPFLLMKWISAFKNRSHD